MGKSSILPQLDDDPRKILGVPEDAGREEIRAAYLEKIKQYPPDRTPGEFERIRDAYTILSDPRSRIRFLMHSSDPEAPLVKLIEGREKTRRHVGPEPWLSAMIKR
ncbi:MAG: J domain-containing protein [Deltaproteobacteria bacterium]|nr:J domain-containing protein [Deltaproteobacteria bacterium]MBW1962392.1 J domain-containing protein [Deltaproteobacteria bacterium]MBW2153551.1 J domain-containing protein [Deltaproteobacteria bacterium]